MPLVAAPDFLETLTQYHPLLRRLCRLYAPGPDEQQDLYQEIVLQLWQAWPRYEARAQLSTWLYRVALNVAISSLRRHTRRPPAARLSAATLDVPAPPPAGPDADDLGQLYAAIARLSDVEKALVLLRLEERPDEEIADILGISIGNVRVKMHRAQHKLRQLLT
ncbi:RNA polymerase sigma factor [Hymenobacter sp. B81]|uniref:RNA polymerase sigma factor n=1 Tax=Hymenobacter sp. B81 TaxID=3344878 RepID=UPI0037DD597C